MKKLFVLTLLIICSQSILTAQEKKRYEIGLTNGSKIEVDKLQNRGSGLGKKHLLADGEKYEYSQVKYYKDGEKFFLKANPTGYGDAFYLREFDGEIIKTYSIIKTYYSAGMPGQVGGNFQSSKVSYYQMRGGSFKDLKYQNLKYDLDDHELSLQKLNEVKKINVINGVFFGAGAAMLIGGIIATSNSAKKNESLPPSERDVSLSPLLFIGVITMNIPWLNGGAKQRKFNEAIALYHQ